MLHKYSLKYVIHHLVFASPLMNTGCWACPIPADRHGGEGRHPRCHPGGEWRSGPDSLLRGHLREHLIDMQPRTVPSNMTWQVLMEQQRSKRCICSNHVKRTNRRKLKITNFLHALQSGNDRKELEKIKNHSLTGGCVSKKMTSPTSDYTAGLSSIQGECWLCRPLPCH